MKMDYFWTTHYFKIDDDDKKVPVDLHYLSENNGSFKIFVCHQNLFKVMDIPVDEALEVVVDVPGHVSSNTHRALETSVLRKAVMPLMCVIHYLKKNPKGNKVVQWCNEIRDRYRRVMAPHECCCLLDSLQTELVQENFPSYGLHTQNDNSTKALTPLDDSRNNTTQEIISTDGVAQTAGIRGNTKLTIKIDWRLLRPLIENLKNQLNQVNIPNSENSEITLYINLGEFLSKAWSTLKGFVTCFSVDMKYQPSRKEQLIFCK